MDQDFQHYFNAITLSRNTINNAFTIIQEQDRSMRDIINLRINQSRQSNSRVRRSAFSDYTSPTWDPWTYNYYTPQYNSTTTNNSNSYFSQRYSEPYNNTSTNTNTNTNTNIYNNPYYIPENRTLSSRLGRYSTPLSNRNNVFDLSNLTPVPIIPTFEEIANGSRETNYSDISEPINTECPITRETFTPTDRVTQLNYCGHIFSTPSFNRWFRSNVRCPICRHDIRDNTGDANNETTSREISRNSNSIPRTETTTRTIDIQNSSDILESIVTHITNDIRTRLDTNNSVRPITLEYGIVIPPIDNNENNNNENNNNENNNNENNNDENNNDENNNDENNNNENNNDENNNDENNND